jgi:hypothetical protein
MKKEENMVIQVPIRHTELKYESDGGAYYPATSGAFSSGHPGNIRTTFSIISFNIKCLTLPVPSQSSQTRPVNIQMGKR